MLIVLLFWGVNLLVILFALCCEPEDHRFVGDKLIYRS
jgi:hypothetical protein